MNNGYCPFNSQPCTPECALHKGECVMFEISTRLANIDYTLGTLEHIAAHVERAASGIGETAGYMEVIANVD